MSTTPTSRLAEVVNRHQDELLDEWVRTQQSSGSRRIDLITDVDLERDSRELLGLLQRALADGDGSGIDGPRWEPVRDFLSGLSRTRAEIGFSPSETAMFVFSLKQPLLARLSNEHGDDAQGLIQIVWEMTDAARPARPADDRGVSEGARVRDRTPATATCSSCPRRWSSYGTASSPCR